MGKAPDNAKNMSTALPGAKCNPLQYIAPNLFKSDRIAVNNANCLTQVACSFAIENLPYPKNHSNPEYRSDFGNFSADHNEHYRRKQKRFALTIVSFYCCGRQCIGMVNYFFFCVCVLE